MRVKKDKGLIQGVYESIRFRMRYVDKLFDSLFEGDVVILQSDFYKGRRFKVIQITDYLIVLEDLKKHGIRTSVSKTDVFCGACKLNRVVNDNILESDDVV
jgi:hypothetical protein